MAVNGAKVSMGALQKFKSDCRNYMDGMDAAMSDLKSALSNVGGSWRDPDFSTISEKTEALDQAIAAAKDVVANELLPFVDSRISVLGSK